jgi:hypothetical protein
MVSMNTSVGYCSVCEVEPPPKIEDPATVVAFTVQTAVGHTVFGGKAK